MKWKNDFQEELVNEMPKWSHYKVSSPSVLVSYGCCNELPQTGSGWFSRLEVWNQSHCPEIKILAGRAPSGASKRDSFPLLFLDAFFSLLGSRPFSLSKASKHLRLHIALCLLCLRLQLLRSLVASFRTLSDNLGYCLLLKINLIISATSLLLYRVTSTGIRT